jgi:hypothetical protein
VPVVAPAGLGVEQRSPRGQSGRTSRLIPTPCVRTYLSIDQQEDMLDQVAAGGYLQRFLSMTHFETNAFSAAVGDQRCAGDQAAIPLG